MKSQDARWLRIRTLFEQAVDLPPDQREAFVDRNCADDAELAIELKELLESDPGPAHGPLTGAIGEAVNATTDDRRQALVGSVIGPYRVDSVIGHGGAGTVYLGERIDRQYSAKVAIKIVESALLNAEIARRFRSERQILANLNHPNIARLLDAGETEQGFPYLVMEYVQGEPIDVYCDRLKLNTEQRIQLMLRVFGAVQYAHQNLVVHRDIKPANILVTADGAPKLLDFGIAKLLDTDALASEMALTRMNDRVLTPEYASPEQILGQPVTTSSDVYALGIALYELLTGMRPYKISSSSQLELERTICVVEPLKPSTIIKQAVAFKQPDKDKDPLAPFNEAFAPPTRDIHAIAEARRLPPQRLAARLGGDLDAILLHALRKEAAYRYASVEQFGADLRRHLSGEPVLARQGTWFYYARKFVRRHAAGVSATAGFIIMLAAAVVVTSLQAKRIQEERDNANREKQTSDAVADFMVNVFASSDPFQTQGREVTADELLDKATATIQSQFNDAPLVKARLLDAMGTTHSRQGDTRVAVQLLEQSLALKRADQTRIQDIDTVVTALHLVRAYTLRSDYELAETTLQFIINVLETSRQTNTKYYVEALNRYAELERRRSNITRSLHYHNLAVPAARRIYGITSPDYGGVLLTYGITLTWSGQITLAEDIAREAVNIYRAASPTSDPDRISAERFLGECLTRTGRLDEASTLLESAYEQDRKLYGDNSGRLVESTMMLARLRLSQGKLDAAEMLARSLKTIAMKSNGEINATTGQAKEMLGVVLWKKGNLYEAERELGSALEIYSHTLPPDHLHISTSGHFLSEVLMAKGNIAGAITQLQATLTQLQRANAAAWRIARSENTLAHAFERSNSRKEAEAYFDRSFPILATSNEVSRDALELAYSRLMHFYKTHDTEKLTSFQSMYSNSPLFKTPK